MHKAFDLGITLFDAADTYGNGLSEVLIAKAFPKHRDEIVIATKVGYDFVHYGKARGRGQREIPVKNRHSLSLKRPPFKSQRIRWNLRPIVCRTYVWP
jgi:aryl-alcohol dehydrogenase-like predicted oxidoreductase